MAAIDHPPVGLWHSGCTHDQSIDLGQRLQHFSVGQRLCPSSTGRTHVPSDHLRRCHAPVAAVSSHGGSGDHAGDGAGERAGYGGLQQGSAGNLLDGKMWKKCGNGFWWMVAAELDGRNWLVGYDEGLKFKHTPDVVEELLCSFQKGIKLPKTASISVHAFALLHQHSLLEHPPER